MLRFLARNRMLNWRYGRLAWRYLWRRLLTSAGRRWRTDGFVFFGRGLEIEIGASGRVDFPTPGGPVKPTIRALPVRG